MLIEISDRTRDLLAQSLPFMEQRKDALIERLGAYLGSAGDADEDAELVAIMLTELMIGQAVNLVRSGDLHDLDDVGHEHRMLRIHGRHYSRYGDALNPVIRDVLGPQVPGEVAGAWGDIFWTIIRAMQALEKEVDASIGARPSSLSDALHPI